MLLPKHHQGVIDGQRAEIERLRNAGISAANGRREFRAAYREQKRQTDKYGVALMTIREGCADPKQVAAEVLAPKKR